MVDFIFIAVTCVFIVVSAVVLLCFVPRLRLPARVEPARDAPPLHAALVQQLEASGFRQLGHARIVLSMPIDLTLMVDALGETSGLIATMSGAPYLDLLTRVGEGTLTTNDSPIDLGVSRRPEQHALRQVPRGTSPGQHYELHRAWVASVGATAPIKPAPTTLGGAARDVADFIEMEHAWLASRRDLFRLGNTYFATPWSSAAMIWHLLPIGAIARMRKRARGFDELRRLAGKTVVE